MKICQRQYLIQILLPLCNNQGKVFPASLYKVVKANLSIRFQGLTAYSRAAAEGLWRVGKKIKREDIVVYEVRVTSLDFQWLREYRNGLERMFDQDSIVIRAQKILIP